MRVSLSNAFRLKSAKRCMTKSFKNSIEVNGSTRNPEAARVFLGQMSLGYSCCKTNVIFIFPFKKTIRVDI